jgi:hypothetical protein
MALAYGFFKRLPDLISLPVKPNNAAAERKRPRSWIFTKNSLGLSAAIGLVCLTLAYSGPAG